MEDRPEQDADGVERGVRASRDGRGLRRALGSLHRPSARQVRAGLLRTLAVVLVSVVVGVTTAHATSPLGPHTATYEVTTDHAVTLDLGPLGTVVIDSPVPFLGARVVVGEIPAELTALDQDQTLSALSGDLDRYVQLFSAPRVTLEAAGRALAVDAARRAAVTAAVLVLAGLVLRRLLGPTRRGELAVRGRELRTPLVAGTLVVVVVAGTMTASDPTTPVRDETRTASRVFDGTPFEGARITGRLAALVDTYGGMALDAYRDNESFYRGATESVTQAWTARMEREGLDPAGRRTSATALPDPHPELVTALVVSDLHCNVGMASVVHEVATLANVDLVLNAGDSTVDGTFVEQYCVDTFARAVPRGVPYVISDGNHDSRETAAQEAAVGATVLRGKVVEVAGLRILGDRDPTATRLGGGTQQTGDETVRDVSRRLADLACDDRTVDLLLVHQPVMGNDALNRGCVPAQVSGHMHKRIGPTRVGEGVRYVSSSTAGATYGYSTLGRLAGTAELTVLRFDARTGEAVDMRLVTVSTSGVGSVGTLVAWPREPERIIRPGEPW